MLSVCRYNFTYNLIFMTYIFFFAGSEVDIWSMGVLLYALLCGFLPFDDNNLENLYRKILVSSQLSLFHTMKQIYKLYILFQSGKYDEPYWLSNNSKMLIRAMLQIDPTKRITVHELCNHPWIIANSLKPVTFVYKTNVRIFQNREIRFISTDLNIFYATKFFSMNI